MALALLAAVVARRARTASGDRSPTAALARLGVDRALGPRLSVVERHRPCAGPGEGDGAAIATCRVAGGARPPSPALRRVIGRVARAMATGAGGQPDTLHAAALVDLAWSGGTGIAIDRSIQYLETAARLSPRPAPVLADLGAAYLARAERTQDVRDVLASVDATRRSIERDSQSIAPRYNLAAALDALGLAEGGMQAWKAYLALDSTSGWAAEARAAIARAASARAVERSAPAPSLAMTPAAASALAARSPQQARLFGWQEVMSAWGAAALAGDEREAARLLVLAGTLGDTLARRGGDRTLADAVRAVHDAVPRGGVRGLAAAHRAFGAARGEFLRASYDSAGAGFARLLDGGAASPPMRAWARYFHAASLVPGGGVVRAAGEFERLVVATDPTRHPALAAHAHWALGTTHMYAGRFEEGLASFRASAALFHRIGETEHLATTRLLQANAEHRLGDLAAAHASMRESMRALAAHRGSPWLHNLFTHWSTAALASGHPRAAAILADEDVRHAPAIGVPVYHAEALLGRARLRLTTGVRDPGGARRDLAAAESVVVRLAPGATRDRLVAERVVVAAQARAGADPARAVATLDTAVTYFEATHNAVRLFGVLVARGEAQLRLGRADAAERDLARVLALLDAEQTAIRAAPLRASLLESAREVVDRLVMLRVAAGRHAEALAYLERGRASFAPAAGRRTGGGRIVAPRGQLLLDLALVGDTLLTWSVVDTTVRLVRRPVDRARLLAAVAWVRASLVRRDDERVARPQLEALYDLLVRPALDDPATRAAVGAGAPLVLVTDGELAGIPFAALRDRVRGRYLVQAHTIRFASTAWDAARAAPRGSPDHVLAVDPGADAARAAELPPLPGAAAEAARIAERYPRRRLLADGEATRDALAAAMRGAPVVHFAGHAVFDDDWPERSRLVVAPSRDGAGSAGGARLTAADVAALDLARVRLVVLSACETARARGGRAGGFAGLVGGFLAAGAGGVVGSVDRVDDGATRALMTGFHDAYRASGDAPAALRAAQLQLLQSSDPALRAPAAWAGFRYAGS